MPYANVKAIKLYYELEGSGSRVLLLNGRGGDLRNPRYPFYNALAAQYTVLTYDHRDRGDRTTRKVLILLRSWPKMPLH